jgi:hypothetical protein
MILIDAANRCWRITRVVKGPVVGASGGRMLRALVRQSVHKLEQDLVELKPLSLDEVKARACDAIRANPDDWRDDDGVLPPSAILLTAHGSRGVPSASLIRNPAGRRK